MNEISANILKWHATIDRDLPWKETADPYFIWLSEIILQQTRVEQGKPYFLKFQKRFPTIHDLANATEEQVLKAWEGLGYYSRARNLHATAKFISKELNGEFPNNYEDILKLRGVGPYTAAAISSFAFGEDKAVVDGNVYRVLSRIYDVDEEISRASAQKYFQLLADQLLIQGKSAEWNQAIMDFGARQCTPKNPNCMFCPVHDNCESFSNGTVAFRPVKKKMKKRKKRYFHYLILRDCKTEETIALTQRKSKDIWKGLFEFPMIESASPKLPEEIKLFKFSAVKPIFSTLQILSHQEIYGIFYEFNKDLDGKDNSELNDPPVSFLPKMDINFVALTDINEYAFPKIINDFLSQYKL